MSAAVARVATQGDHDLFGDYLAHCRRLQVSDRALRDRLRAAREFLAADPDLQAWMDTPAMDRVVELRRIGAGRCWRSRSAPAGCAWTWSWRR